MLQVYQSIALDAYVFPLDCIFCGRSASIMMTYLAAVKLAFDSRIGCLSLTGCFSAIWHDCKRILLSCAKLVVRSLESDVESLVSIKKLKKGGIHRRVVVFNFYNNSETRYSFVVFLTLIHLVPHFVRIHKPLECLYTVLWLTLLHIQCHLLLVLVLIVGMLRVTVK